MRDGKLNAKDAKDAKGEGLFNHRGTEGTEKRKRVWRDEFEFWGLLVVSLVLLVLLLISTGCVSSMMRAVARDPAVVSAELRTSLGVKEVKLRRVVITTNTVVVGADGSVTVNGPAHKGEGK